MESIWVWLVGMVCRRCLCVVGRIMGVQLLECIVVVSGCCC